MLAETGAIHSQQSIHLLVDVQSKLLLVTVKTSSFGSLNHYVWYIHGHSVVLVNEKKKEICELLKVKNELWHFLRFRKRK